jgi:hypothetical protein
LTNKNCHLTNSVLKLNHDLTAKNKSSVHSAGTSSPPELRLAFCDHKAMRLALLRWYYRDDLPVGKLVRVGVWEDSTFCGVIVFGMGSSGKIGMPYGLNNFECSEMCRVALGAHRTVTSRIISIALRVLKKQSPGIRAVVSYCDPAAGHVGTIYQAMGWTFTGTTPPDKRYTDAAGKQHHSRQVSASGLKKIIGGLARVPKASECTVEKLPGKYRYVWPFDAEIRERLKLLAKPYPKSARGKENVPPRPPAGEARCDSEARAPISTPRKTKASLPADETEAASLA